VRSQIDSSYAALYVPWITTPIRWRMRKFGAHGNQCAAVGFMAGVWARSDEKNGVAKTPANEVVLKAVSLERNITYCGTGSAQIRAGSTAYATSRTAAIASGEAGR